MGLKLRRNRSETLKGGDWNIYARNPETLARRVVVPNLHSNKKQSAEALLAAQLRNYLGERLPEYMVPATVVVSPHLPLNASGKLDRNALPQPPLEDLGTEIEAPRTSTEARIAAIWRKVLKLDQVGREANFFALGGHSLLATQVVSRIRADFMVELPLRVLFTAPTVAGLAEHIERALARKTEKEIPAIEPASREGRLPLSFAQQRLWFLSQMEGVSEAYHVPSGCDCGRSGRAALAPCAGPDCGAA